MSEQVFLDFSLNFNLRQTKKNMPTIIYALFTFRGDNTRSILEQKFIQHNGISESK